MSTSGSVSADRGLVDPSRVTLARQRRGLTMTGLARGLGFTPRTVSTYEREGAPAGAGARLGEVLQHAGRLLRPTSGRPAR